MRWVLLLFVVVPLVELYLLLWLSSVIGFWQTVGLTLVTGIVGGTLAKREGMRVWRAWRAALEELRPPPEGVVEGVLVLVGGALLITPGVLTDVAGLALLVPLTRRRIAAVVRRAVDRRIARGQIRVTTATFGAATLRRSSDVLDTTGESVEGDTRPSGQLETKA
jgi:UPF0716 protein FxsA